MSLLSHATCLSAAYRKSIIKARSKSHSLLPCMHGVRWSVQPKTELFLMPPDTKRAIQGNYFLCAGTKKKKSRAQKTAIGQSSIPAPLPHSTVNYSKFDNIGDSDDDEEKKGSADHPWCGPEGCNCPSCRSIRGFSVNSDGESVSDDEEDIVPITPKKGKHEATSDSTGSAASQQTEAKAQKPTEKAKKQGLQAGFFAAQTGNKHSSDAGSKLKQKQKQGALSTSQSVKTPSSMRGSASDDDDDGSLPSLVTGRKFWIPESEFSSLKSAHSSVEISC